MIIDEHLEYLSDRRKVKLYECAIQSIGVVGKHVVDLGCGSGILGILCLRHGARKVTFIESSPALDLARESVARLGQGDKCAFIRGRSQRVDVPDKADVVICDHVGFFGFDYELIETLQDARRRFLKPGGIIAPQSLELNLAAAESQESRAKVDAFLSSDVPEEFMWLHRYKVNGKLPVLLTPDELLSEPVSLGLLDLYADQPTLLSWSATLTARRAGVVHGLLGWFKCELADGVDMTNSPLYANSIQRPQAFLPLSEPRQLLAGDQLRVNIFARPVDNLISWNVQINGVGRELRQSTFQSWFIDPVRLMKADRTRTPRLSKLGRARRVILGYCNGERTIEEIEALVLAEHPDLMPTRGEIAGFVAEVLARDSEL